MIEDLIDSAFRSLDRAGQLRDRGSDAVRAELERIHSLSDRLTVLGPKEKRVLP